MSVPRQAQIVPVDTGGRVNQKRRTRTAIVTAAQQLLDRGVTPTVARAAEQALVSRTTAYRYFPNQESLLLDLSINIDVSELDELVATPLDNGDVEARLLELFELFNRHVLADETLYRTSLRFYLDTWLAANGAGKNDETSVREGRRTGLIAKALEPLEGKLPDADMRRLQAALCLVAGVEAMVVMRDVCRLGDDEALQVTRWAADAIVRAGLHPDQPPPGPGAP
jgi:AcrR family transcriptional regulator